MPTVWTRLLDCTVGSSDKEYQIEIDEEPHGAFTVKAHSRRRYKSWTFQGVKGTGSLLNALGIADDLTRQKTKKGYRVVQTNDNTQTATAPTPALSPANPFAAMPAFSRAEDADPGEFRMEAGDLVQPSLASAEQLQALWEDPAWVAYPQRVGALALIARRGLSISVRDALGIPVYGFKKANFNEKQGDFDLVGTLDDAGIIHAFDLLEIGGRSIRGYGFRDRFLELVHHFGGGVVAGVNVEFVETEMAWLALESEMEPGVKGVVFRRFDAAPSDPGVMVPRQIQVPVLVTGVQDGLATVGAHPAIGKGYSKMPVEWKGLPPEVVIGLGSVEVPEGVRQGDRILVGTTGLLNTNDGLAGMTFLSALAPGPAGKLAPVTLDAVLCFDEHALGSALGTAS